ncbi:hypothetical protein ACFS6H_15140 [Terrimonas rubra]|uniref:Uncharacterized protein n=1 Tax=Terrimonas rubra TaxID=1035890 RepID=A0ABW6A6T7_9BACT
MERTAGPCYIDEGLPDGSGTPYAVPGYSGQREMQLSREQEGDSPNTIITPVK